MVQGYMLLLLFLNLELQIILRKDMPGSQTYVSICVRLNGLNLLGTGEGFFLYVWNASFYLLCF